MTKQVQEGKCYRIYGPYKHPDYVTNRKVVYWVFDKSSKEKHVVRSLQQAMELIEGFQSLKSKRKLK